MQLILKLTLVSDTTFGRGDGVSGLVDQEIEYDSATGLPTVRGRTLKGLLVEECANILFALKGTQAGERLAEAAQRLFGKGGSTLADGGALHVGTAQIEKLELRQAIADDIAAGRLQADEVLETFTTIRRQTAIDEATGTPHDGSLRSSRVLLRETVLSAPLSVELPGDDADALALLCACAAGLRRGGAGRNRGRGRLCAEVVDRMQQGLEHFKNIVNGGSR